MKTYDVTIRLTVVNLDPYPIAMDFAAQVAKVCEQIPTLLIDGPTKAVKFEGCDVVDRDSLPQPAPLCARCNCRV